MRTFTLLVAALAAVSLAACGKDDEDKGGRKVTVELTDAGCSPLRLRIPAGPTTFEATNEGTDKATEFEVLQGDRVLGEKENITEGLSGSFSLDLDPGRYQIWCGQGTPKGVLEVTGKASSAAANPKLAAAVRGYDRYVRAQVLDPQVARRCGHQDSRERIGEFRAHAVPGALLPPSELSRGFSGSRPSVPGARVLRQCVVVPRPEK